MKYNNKIIKQISFPSKKISNNSSEEIRRFLEDDNIEEFTLNNHQQMMNQQQMMILLSTNTQRMVLRNLSHLQSRLECKGLTLLNHQE